MQGQYSIRWVKASEIKVGDYILDARAINTTPFVCIEEIDIQNGYLIFRWNISECKKYSDSRACGLNEGVTKKVFNSNKHIDSIN
jgi:intein/homing endonuclease